MTSHIRLLAPITMLLIILAGISLMPACGGEPELTSSEIMAIVHECLDQDTEALRGELRQVFLEGYIDYYARSAEISYEDAIVPAMEILLEVQGCAIP